MKPKAGTKAKGKAKPESKAKAVPKAAVPQEASAASSSASASAAETVAVVTKSKQSGFVMYLKGVIESGAQDDKKKRAADVLSLYQQLDDPGTKRRLVSDFYGAGGKAAGLERRSEQVILHRSQSSQGLWEGWATPSMIAKFCPGQEGRL